MTADRKKGQQSAPARRSSSPGFEHRIYSPHSIAALTAELGKQGIQTALALEGTGLAASQLDNHKTQISYHQLDTVLRNTLRLSRDPLIALRAGQRMHLTAYGMYGYALLSSATHAEARDFAARYAKVIGPFCGAKSSCVDATVVCVFEPLHWPDPKDDIHRLAIEFALSAHLVTIRDRAGSAFRFSRVNLAYSPPPYAEIYNSLFECPVRFEQLSSGYSYDLVRADGPVELADPRTHAMAREMCEQILGEINRGGGVAAEIRRVLIEQPGHYPSIETIATKLGMHPRALRRKLGTEGTSYRDLLAEVRMRLAIEYLRMTQMTNEEIAGRLGYSDASNFRHAFTRWTGKSPSEFRTVDRG